jgi:hypothetical protein
MGKTVNKNKNIMGKRFLSLIVIILISFQIQAQSLFSIKITQVYPPGGVVYGNMYDLSGELDKAEAQLRSQYNSKNANYIMELTRPSGKETKYIQNICWILIENGTKTNCKSKPTLKEFYPEPTIVESYACDIYGKLKSYSNYEKFEYDYYYSYCFRKGKERFRCNNQIQGIYWTRNECDKGATKHFFINKVDSLLCIIKIFNSKGMPIDSFDNKKEHNQYLSRKHIADSIQQANKTAELKRQKALDDSIKKAMEKPVYNKQKIEKELNKLLARIDSLKDGQPNFRRNVDEIISEADKIVKILEADTITFDRNKYFETADLKYIKTGLKKLLEINQKKVVSNNKKEVDMQLKILQLKANELKKGSKNYRQGMDDIIDEADKIIEDLKIDNKKFDRDKYFEGELEDLKKGIETLITINNKRK